QGLGGALRFAGSQWLTLSGNELDLSNGRFTQALWVYPEADIETLPIAGGPAGTTCPATRPLRAEYFANQNLTGTPAKIVCETLPLTYDWSTQGPAALGGQQTNFSVRWTANVRTLRQQFQKFRVMHDDRLTVKLNDYVMHDENWRRDSKSWEHELTAGTHTLVVEYRQATGPAYLDVRWEALLQAMSPQGILGSETGNYNAYPSLQRVNGTSLQATMGTGYQAATTCALNNTTGTFTAEWFTNPNLSGDPQQRDCHSLPLNFNWGTGGVSQLGGRSDNFSLRLTGQLRLAAGRHSLAIDADDGVRIRLNGQVVFDRWNSLFNGLAIFNVPHSGIHTLTLEYRELTWDARLIVRPQDGVDLGVSRVFEGVLPLHTWSHVVTTFDGTTYRLYVNGVERGNDSVTFKDLRPAPATSIFVGRSSNYGEISLHQIEVKDEGDGAGNAEYRIYWNTDQSKSNLIYSRDNVSAGQTLALNAIHGLRDFRYLRFFEDDGGGANDDLLLERRFSTNEPSDCSALRQFYNADGEGYLSFGWPGDRHLVGQQPYHCTFANNAIPFRGMLDEFALYHTPLQAEQVAQLYTRANALLHYRFDDPAGAGRSQQGFRNAITTSGLSNGTCLTEAASCPTSGLPGRSHLATAFDGIDDGINAGAVPLANESFTIAFWAKRDGRYRWETVISQGESQTNRGLRLGFTVDNRFRCGFLNTELITRAAFTDQNWHHWACTYNKASGERVIYRDGQRVAGDRTNAGAGYQGSGALLIGTDTTTFFAGMLDEL
ncbi:MAG: hypothetical protein EOM24_14335, partial [Chloroflexia bacterium]|nr:hypothetical protein [Chloroflexia bacterium]